LFFCLLGNRNVWAQGKKGGELEGESVEPFSVVAFAYSMTSIDISASHFENLLDRLGAFVPAFSQALTFRPTFSMG
jgi:hypothetical protein